MTRFSKRKKNITRRRNNGRLNKTRHNPNKKRRTKKQVGGMRRSYTDRLPRPLDAVRSMNFDDLKTEVKEMSAGELNDIINEIDKTPDHSINTKTKLNILTAELVKATSEELDKAMRDSLNVGSVPTKTCPLCTFDNDAALEKCEICDAHLNQATPTVHDSVVGLTPGHQLNAARASIPAGAISVASASKATSDSLNVGSVPTKTCPRCTFVNNAALEKCKMCDAYLNQATKYAPPPDLDSVVGLTPGHQRNAASASKATKVDVATTVMEAAQKSVVGLTSALKKTTFGTKEYNQVKNQLDAATAMYNTEIKKMLCSEDNIKTKANKLVGFYDKTTTTAVLNNLCRETHLDQYVLDFLDSDDNNISDGFLNVFQPAFDGYLPPIKGFKQIIEPIDTVSNSGRINRNVSNKCWVISLANMYRVEPDKLYNLILKKLPNVSNSITNNNDMIDAVEFMRMINIPLPNGLILISLMNGMFDSENQEAPFFIIEPLSANTPVIVNYGQYHFQYGENTLTIRAIRKFIIENKAYANNLENNAPIQITQREINRL
jgi:hypothetical protein